MKKNTNYLTIMLLTLALPFFMAVSCSDKPVKEEPPPTKPPVELVPSITSITPATGNPGIDVTILGENFGSKMSDLKVVFGSNTTEVTAFSKTKVTVKVPAGVSNTNVNVTVNVGGKTSNVKEFFYAKAPPTIATISASCFYGSPVVITGSNFSLTKEDNIVKFGTTVATVTEATAISLHVTTPDLGTANSTEVTVTGKDGTSSPKSIAVDVDQNKVATYAWTTHTVKPGVIYKSGELSLFGTAQRKVFILDVTLNSSNTLGIGFSTTNVATTTMNKNYNAVAGINAGYFQLSGSTPKDPYIRINGATVQAGTASTSAIFTNSALIIHNNEAKVKKFTEFITTLNQTAAAIPVADAENIIVSGPMLITGGVLETVDMNNSHNTSKTARTGLGVSADGKRVFMVVVDSYSPFTGVSTPELAKILQALGAVDAMNFDGGGSSTMYVKDQGDNGRVNLPYGTPGQRAVASIIYVK